MVSGKPKTGGLAALLRVEKERREREEAEQEASSQPPSGDQPQERFIDTTRSHEANSTVEQGHGVDSSRLDSAVQEPEPFSGEALQGEPSLNKSTDQAAAPQARTSTTSDPSLPRSRPSPIRTLRPKRVEEAPSAATGGEMGPGWEKFVADWKPFLREGVKFKLCEFFYQNTAARGKREFTTSSSQLARVAGSHRRHIFLVLSQLEELKFIRKRSVETNRKDEGLIIYFSPDRQA